MIGQGKEICDIPELFIVTVVSIASCKLFRNKYISLGGVGLIKALKRLLAALELLNCDVWLKICWEKPDVARCWAPSLRTARDTDSLKRGVEPPQFYWNQSDPEGATTSQKSSCGSWRPTAGSGLKCHIRDVTAVANKSLFTHIYMSTCMHTHTYILPYYSVFHCSNYRSVTFSKGNQGSGNYHSGSENLWWPRSERGICYIMIQSISWKTV